MYGTRSAFVRINARHVQTTSVEARSCVMSSVDSSFRVSGLRTQETGADWLQFRDLDLHIQKNVEVLTSFQWQRKPELGF